MPTLREVLNTNRTNEIGEIVFSLEQPSPKHILMNNQILLQANYPILFSKVGLLDGDYDELTEFILPEPTLLLGDGFGNAYIKGD